MAEVIVLYCDQDGEHHVDQMTESELLDRLESGDYGEDVPIAEVLPTSLESFWGLIIFRAPLVVPRQIDVKTTWNIPK